MARKDGRRKKVTRPDVALRSVFSNGICPFRNQVKAAIDRLPMTTLPADENTPPGCELSRKVISIGDMSANGTVDNRQVHRQIVADSLVFPIEIRQPFRELCVVDEAMSSSPV